MGEIGTKAWAQMSADGAVREQLNAAQLQVMGEFIEGKLDEIAGDLAGQTATIETIAAFKVRFAKAFVADGMITKLIDAMSLEEKENFPYDLDVLARWMTAALESALESFEQLSEGALQWLKDSNVSEGHVLGKSYLSRASVKAVLKRKVTIADLLATDASGMTKLNGD